jgi:hypothetical protein
VRLAGLVAVLVTCALVACADRVNLAGGDGGVDFADADPFAPDAGPSPGCMPGGRQCNDCIDNDGDGQIDGHDAECTGLIDDDEASFATGIDGDNIDSKTQDCFFDGNSGGGDDTCAYHTCCILDLGQQPGGACPSTLQPPKFDADDRTLAETCINNCRPLTPPGCDCFGCCTVCNDSLCRNVYTNPAVAPDCTYEALADTSRCPSCVKTLACANPCNPLECILCPGQSEDDLPADCNGTHACPPGQATCTLTADCLSGQFCSYGCCIEGIE